MTTKEKVIRESIDRISNELFEINHILNAQPISDIIEIRKQAQELMKGEGWRKPEVIEKIRILAIKEKAAFQLAKKQTNGYIQRIERKVKLDVELGDLKSELYFIEMRKGK